jgi:hypothetical protein
MQSRSERAAGLGGGPRLDEALQPSFSALVELAASQKPRRKEAFREDAHQLWRIAIGATSLHELLPSHLSNAGEKERKRHTDRLLQRHTRARKLLAAAAKYALTEKGVLGLDILERQRLLVLCTFMGLAVPVVCGGME